MLIAMLGWSWVALLLVVQPVSAYLGRGRVATQRPPRLRLYRGSALGIGAIGLITLLLDVAGSRRGFSPLGAAAPAGAVGRWTAATVIAMAALWLGVQLGRRTLRRPPGAGYLHLLPRTTPERIAFAALSLLAGMSEEYAVRGFCLVTIAAASGSTSLAVGVTTVGFGLGHAYQGWGGVLRTTAAGALLVTPLLLTGSLVPAMVGHATLDVMTGLLTLPVLRAWGVVPLDAGRAPA